MGLPPVMVTNPLVSEGVGDMEGLSVYGNPA
jgi:hypothetical protein